MENNDMNDHLKSLMSSLTGMTNCLEATVTDAFKGMGNEQAIEFAKAFESAKISDKLEEITKKTSELKSDLNIQ